MKVIIRVIPLLLLVGLAASFTFTDTKIDYTFGGAKLIHWDTTSVISAEEFPCELDGPVRHPKNCSQFYRCLKISTKSNMYNRYLYECPETYVYSSRDQMCVFGKCVGDIVAQSSSGGGSGSMVGTGADSGPESIRVTGADSGSGNTEGSSTDGGSGTAGDSEGSSSVGQLPEVIDQSSTVVSSSDIETSESEQCKKYLYVQVKEFCNVFRRCSDTRRKILYSCVRGTGFKTTAQMCRIASFDQFICLGKRIFKPKESVFREVFDMDNVVIVSLDQTDIANANPFTFTNHSTWLENALPNAPEPMPLKTLLRFAEFSQDEKASQETTILQDESGKIPVGTGSILGVTKPTVNEMLSGISKLTQSIIPENYQLVAAIQYPFQYTNPYDFSGTGPAQQLSGVQQATGSQYAIPVYISGFQSPTSASSTPSSTFLSQATPFHQILRQNSWPSSGGSSYPYVSPFRDYSHPYQGIKSPFTPTGFSSGSYSPYVLSPHTGALQWPYSLSSILSSPSNYLSSQTQNSFIPGSIPYKAPGQSASANSYETFQFKPIQNFGSLAGFDASKQKITGEKTPVLKENTFYDPTDIQNSKYTFLHDPASAEVDSIQSRTEDREGYHVISLSNEDILSLVEHNIGSQTSQYDGKYEE